MKADNVEKSRYFYEYAFAQMVRDHNEVHPEDLIRTSEARAIRDRIMQECQKTGKPTVSYGEYNHAVNMVLDDRLGYNIVAETGGAGAYIEGFKAITGFGEQKEEYGGKDYFIPISPYDSLFRNREAILNNGSSITYMAMDQVADLKDASSVVNGHTRDVYVMREGSGGMTNMVRTNDRFMNEADRTGMSRLMGYMTEKEYKDVAGWVRDGFTGGNAKTAAEQQNDYETRMKHMDKSVAILQGLREMGYDYKISRDAKPGQIQAELTGTRIKVRITEQEGLEHYIGRVYDGGTQVYYSTSKVAKNKMVLYTDASPEECLDLVKFAMNAPMKEWRTDRAIGEAKQVKAGNNSINNAYCNKDALMVVAGNLSNDSDHKVFYRMDTRNRSQAATKFLTTDDANRYLMDAVMTARENYQDLVGVEKLIKLAEKHKDESDYTPNFSGDVSISAMQQMYWGVLTGKETELLKSGKELDEYESYVNDIGSADTIEEYDVEYYKKLKESLKYEGSPADMVRSHLRDNTDHIIGHFEKDADGKRFNPVIVSLYQTSAYGTYRNTEDIVEAVRTNGIQAEELKGSEYYNENVKNKLIQFDEASAKPMMEHENPFVQRMYQEVKGSLQRCGVTVKDKDILFDDQGIVRYKGSIETSQKATTGKNREFTGEIGQIFVPDKLGMLETKFHGTTNYYCVPGYEATILPQKPGENKNVSERTRLKGYEQIMTDQIRYQIRQDVAMVGKGETEAGNPYTVNNVYRRLYDERHPLNFMEQYEAQGLSREITEAIIKTEASRVRYSNEIRDGATINAQYFAENFGTDLANDNVGNAFNLVGGKNMAVLDEDVDGYFDQAATSSGMNQGITRYLTEGAKVNADGSITPSENKNDRCPVLNLNIARYMSFDPPDRQQMGFSVLMQASAVIEKVNIAQVDAGGWTQDDSIPISKEFAERAGMLDRNGNLRDMMAGDKLSHLSGNKGVIPLVVDRNMSMEEAKEQGLEHIVAFFKKNPELDVVMAPYSAVSRFNAGMTKELMENPKDLVLEDGTVVPGGMGQATMVVTNKTAESKTHIYGDDDVAKGRGRKASSQLAWALQSQECDKTMNAFYRQNNGSLSNVRELLIATGLDMSETGVMRVGYQPHQGEERQVFEMPKLKYTASGFLDMASMKKDLNQQLAKSGGVMELPFPLKYPTGEEMPMINEKKTNVIYKTEEWTRKGYTRKDGVYVPETTVRRKIDSSERITPTDGNTYSMPVLSSYLRSGQQMEDGTNVIHDYTNQYLSIFEQATKYRNAKEQLKTETDPVKIKRYNDVIQEAPEKAQAAYNVIANDIMHRAFEGKHNIAKENIMGARQTDSASVILTADPRLGIDEFGVSKAMAESMRLNDKELMYVFRDPILNDGGLRALKTVAKEDIVGGSINPAIAQSFQADFDGDTVGGKKNNAGESVAREMDQKLSMKANLLNYNAKREDGTYELYMHHALDTKVSAYFDPSLNDRWEEIMQRVNQFEKAYKDGTMSDELLDRNREQAVSDLNSFYHDAYSKPCGQVVIRYDSPENHLRSLKEACIDTGAKGSLSKLQSYMKQWGATCELNEDKTDFKYETLKLGDKTLATREDAKNTQYATAVKSGCTGLAGSVSQRGVLALRNTELKPVLECTFGPTQSVLQIKHDPAQARQKQDLLMSATKHVWNGNKIELGYDTNGREKWMPVRDDKGKIVKANPDEWVDMFYNFYTSKEGLDTPLNKDFVRRIASAMTDRTNHTIIGVDEMGKKAPLLDRWAYGGNFETLFDAAKKNEPLFSGKTCEFMPGTMKQNIKQLESLAQGKIEEVQLKSITKSDTQVDKEAVKETISLRRRVPDISDLKAKEAMATDKSIVR